VTKQDPLKWVFSLTGVESPALASYEEMAKIAVLSALENTTLIPVCIYFGEPGAMTDWLTSHGVRVIS
jgi:hypothetical protein